MPDAAATILQQLESVERERAARAADALLNERVQALKAWQQRRFATTYTDLLASPRYESAARFFLEELYGPRDYRQRDAQFARVVPALVRLFPDEIVHTVSLLAQLHALSERLDTTMARHLQASAIAVEDYRRAWVSTGGRNEREGQIRLMLDVGAALDRHTKRRLLRHSLRMMRGPARAAGLEELQRFLESGFDTFGAMRGADDFLATVGTRERSLAAALFRPDGAGEPLPFTPIPFPPLP